MPPWGAGLCYERTGATFSVDVVLVVVTTVEKDEDRIDGRTVE